MNHPRERPKTKQNIFMQWIAYGTNNILLIQQLTNIKLIARVLSRFAAEVKPLTN